MTFFRQTTLDDVNHVIDNIRYMDKVECWYQTQTTIDNVLKFAFLDGSKNETISSEDGKALGLCGVSKDCRVWMVGTDELFKKKADRLFLIQDGKLWVDRMLKSHSLLYNFVYAENKPAIKWLKALGFSFINFHPRYGTFKKPFYEFVRIN